MFIPIVGIFTFGNGATRGGALAGIITGLINILLASLGIFLGLYFHILFLTILGFIFGALGFLMTLLGIISFFSIRRREGFQHKS